MVASMAKVWSTELRYRLNSLAMDLLGRSGGLSKGSEGAPLDGDLEQGLRGSPVGRHVEALVEVSLQATEAARDAVQEILRRGADTGIFFAGKERRGEPSSELTSQDKEFLRAVSIKPDR